MHHFQRIFIDLDSPLLLASICIWYKFGAFIPLLLLFCLTSSTLSKVFLITDSKNLDPSIFFSNPSKIYFFFSNKKFISVNVFCLSHTSFPSSIVLELLRLFIFLVLIFH